MTLQGRCCQLSRDGDPSLRNEVLPGLAAGLPSLASDKVARVGPVDAERSAGAVGICHARMAIVPVGVVVAVVVAGAGANCLTLLYLCVFSGSGQDASNGGEAGKEGSEGDHDFDCFILLVLIVVD